MSNELINALETRVGNAIETIEELRSEIKVLKEERQLLEEKLRELLQKIEGAEAAAESAPAATNPYREEDPQSGNVFGRPGTGPDPTQSEY